MLPLNECRGLNRQQAIFYLGIKGTYFDKAIRPKLHPIKMGTSLIFDRLELDNVFDEIMLDAGDVGPNVEGAQQWPKKPQVSPKQMTADGESTKLSQELDFKAVLQHLRTQKTG
jgi:hypothetical protein